MSVDPKHILDSGCAALARGDVALALASLKDAERLLPNDAQAAIAHGLALAVAGREKEAVEALARGVAIDAMRPDAWCAMGEIKLASGDLLGATDALQACVKLDPGGLDPVANRARMLLRSLSSRGD